MPERYCPKCKQNVEMVGGVWDACANCGYEFNVIVDKVDIESLVRALEKSGKQLGILHHSAGYDRAHETAAKFRKKYLTK